MRTGQVEKRADLVLLVNGIPLVVIEAKTPVRSSESWFDGAVQIHDDYERNVPELFVPNVFSVATEGKEFRYGSIGLPVQFWGPWRIDADTDLPSLKQVSEAGRVDAASPKSSSTCSPTSRPTRPTSASGDIKIIARYQQFEGANRIVERVRSRAARGKG